MLEGFRLLLKYDYVKGIFALSCLFMVEVTILDYAMKVIVIMVGLPFAAVYARSVSPLCHWASVARASLQNNPNP